MKKILLVLGLFLISPQLALAQSQRNPCYYTLTGNTSCIPVGTNTSGVSNGPLPVGGIANAAAPTFVEGKVGGMSFDLNGNLRITGGSGGLTAAVTIANGADVALGTTTDAVATTPTTGSAATTIALLKAIANGVTSPIPAGTNVIGHVITDTTSVTNATLSAETTKVIGTVNQGTSPWITSTAPSSSATIGITPIVSASGESSHVLKAGAGNAYSIYATNLTATAGFLLILNSTTAPGDGAVTPLACAPLAPNGVAALNYAPGPPGVFSIGITAVVTSATTCFTKTTGVITAFISGSVQ